MAEFPRCDRDHNGPAEGQTSAKKTNSVDVLLLGDIGPFVSSHEALSTIIGEQ